MVAQKDIALKLGISRTAVSAILAGSKNTAKFRPEMRQKVLQAAEELGYQHNELARAVRTGRNNVIGFVTQKLSIGYSGILLNGIIQATAEFDFSIRIIPLGHDRDAAAVAKQCVGQCLAGVVVYDIEHREFLSDLFDLLKRRHIPMAVAGSNVALDKGIRIESDTLQGGRLAFEHLYRLGHRRILPALSYSWASYSQNLLRGFLDAGQKAQEPVEIIPVEAKDMVDNQIVIEILRRKKATACFCNSDFAALHLISLFQHHGIRVPDDVSVIGRGNLFFCTAVVPEITSLDESLENIGKRTAELLLNGIQKQTDEELTELIPHKIVVRNSTGPVLTL